MQPRAIRKYVNVLFKSLWAMLEAWWGGGKGALACLGFRQRENFSVGISVKRFFFFHTQEDGIGLDEG